MKATHLAREHADTLRAILKSNEDLPSRLRDGVKVYYDSEDDYAVIQLSEVQEAISESLQNCLFLRVDPETLQILAIEMPNLTQRMQEQSVLRDLWLAFIQLAGAEIAEFPKPDADPSERVAQDIRQLVHA